MLNTKIAAFRRKTFFALLAVIASDGSIAEHLGLDPWKCSDPLASASGEGDVLEMALPVTGPVNQVSISENISEGQRVRVYKVEGLVPGEGWKILCSGTSVGHKRIQMFEPAVVSKVRFTATKTAAMPVIRDFAVWNVSGRIVKT